MNVRGKINSQDNHFSLPLASPTYHPEDEIVRNYRGLENLSFTYISDADSLSRLILDVFEIEAEPVTTFSFSRTDFSLAGTYVMANLAVEVIYDGQKFKLDLHQFLTSMTPAVCGRELLGVSKVDGHIDVTRHESSALVSSRLERPQGHLLATGVFRPDVYHGEQGKSITERVGVRVIPSLKAGTAPDIFEVTRFTSESWGAELWTGAGTVNFTGASDIDPIHWAPVKKLLKCSYTIGGKSKTTIHSSPKPIRP
ncbi:acetoacetate decarboxylase family protein [Pusillimonas sp. SM2304]|uniref:acetoacetate decarboxylase family protein n=1 Tax=Pusillimonas sp. SM2304 TaxID=3073241 RepID=UPI0028749D40|nr:acetoacetate decarboxylase family protein [Pusillimonas sp. SM2304]MDS1140112.1 acetoacetate decarboxylase family protein [Pusillimonas sp. SM2304]